MSAYNRYNENREKTEADKKHQQNNAGGGVMGTLMVAVIAIINFLCSVAISFGPALIASYLFYKVGKKMKSNMTNKQERWVLFWSVMSQLTLYVAGYLVFKKLCWVKGEFHLSGIAGRIHNKDNWYLYFNMVLFVFVPCLSIYLMKVSDFFRDQEISDEKLCFHKTKFSTIGMFATTTLFYPLAFIYYGARANKTSWLVSGILYVISPVCAIGVVGKFDLIKTSFNTSALYSIGVMWVIAMLHTYKIRHEFLARTNSNKVIHIVDEVDSDGFREVREVA